MSVLLAEATVKVHTDVSGAGRQAESSMKKQGGLFSKIGAVAGGILGAQLAFAAGRAIKSVFTTGANEAKDASAGQAQLAAGIKSTGNAANVTIKGLLDRASALQAMSGQTDDSIVKTEGLLLTFTKIKNSGPNKVFDDATLAAANMSARMGGDASSSAIQLGKALNDPIKGISSLSRVGVTFDDAQKKTIATMVKTGNVAGAQRVILAELNKEFGGSAAAQGQSLPGVLARIRRGYEDVTQSVAEGIIPIVLPALRWIADRAGTAGAAVAKGMSVIQRALGGIDFSAIIKGVVAFSPLMIILRALQPFIPQLVAAFMPLVKSVFSVLQTILPVVVGLVQTLLGALMPLIAPVLDIVTAFMPLVGVLAQLLGSILKPVIALLGILLKPILALIGPLIKALVPALSLVASTLGDVIDWISKGIDWFGKLKINGVSVSELMGKSMTMFGTILGVVFKTIGGVISWLIKMWVSSFKTATDIGMTLGTTYRKVFTGVTSFIKTAFTSAVAFVKNGINGVISLVNGAINALDKLHVKVPDWIPGIGGQDWSLGIPRIPMLARGSNSAPDSFIAGENGPELITGAGGSTVRPYDITKDLLAGGRGDIYNLALSVNFDDIDDVKRFVNMLKSLPQIARASRPTTKVA